MVEENQKNKLYIITITLDFFIIYLLLNFELNLIDIIWCLTVLICHITFLYALKTDYKDLLDFLHIFVFAIPFFSVFTTNVITKIVTCVLLYIIQLLWIKEKKCILNEEQYDFGYGDYISYYTLSLSILLSFQAGYYLHQLNVREIYNSSVI
uniref:Uncharacterized protein n=1 Tax=viral metagenome TaxID=1070528 RepID=A0A6C0FEW8_9ZZZZ|tara:strand:- start:494 stop:949 length:456 start_codon:yes stop_codon:yes gene_type:complete